MADSTSGVSQVGTGVFDNLTPGPAARSVRREPSIKPSAFRPTARSSGSSETGTRTWTKCGCRSPAARRGRSWESVANPRPPGRRTTQLAYMAILDGARERRPAVCRGRLADADPRGDRSRLTAEACTSTIRSGPPDGQWIYFVARHGTGGRDGRLARSDPSGGSPEQLTHLSTAANFRRRSTGTLLSWPARRTGPGHGCGPSTSRRKVSAGCGRPRAIHLGFRQPRRPAGRRDHRESRRRLVEGAIARRRGRGERRPAIPASCFDRAGAGSAFSVEPRSSTFRATDCGTSRMDARPKSGETPGVLTGPAARPTGATSR